MDITVEYVRKVLEDERSRKSQPTPDSPVYKAKTRIAIEQFDGGKSLLDDINGYLSNTDWQDQSVGQSYKNKINTAKSNVQGYKNFVTKNYDEEIAKQYNDYFDSVLKQYGDWETAVNKKNSIYSKYENKESYQSAIASAQADMLSDIDKGVIGYNEAQRYLKLHPNATEFELSSYVRTTLSDNPFYNYEYVKEQIGNGEKVSSIPASANNQTVLNNALPDGVKLFSGNNLTAQDQSGRIGYSNTKQETDAATENADLKSPKLWREKIYPTGKAIQTDAQIDMQQSKDATTTEPYDPFSNVGGTASPYRAMVLGEQDKTNEDTQDHDQNDELIWRYSYLIRLDDDALRQIINEMPGVDPGSPMEYRGNERSEDVENYRQMAWEILNRRTYENLDRNIQDQLSTIAPDGKDKSYLQPYKELLKNNGLTEEQSDDLIEWIQGDYDKSKDFFDLMASNPAGIIAGTMYGTFTRFIGSPIAVTGMVADVVNANTDDNYTESDAKARAQTGLYAYGSNMINAISEKISNDVGSDAAFLYSTVTSMLESAYSMPFFIVGGPVGTAAGIGSVFLNSTAGSYIDALDRGGTINQAALYASVSGLIEVATEYIPLSNISDLATKGSKRLLTSVFKQSGIEAAEEGISAVANIFADNAIMKDQSQYNQLVQYYMENEGLSYEEAVRKAALESSKGVLLNILGGGISGSVFGGIGGAIGNRQTNAAYRQAGNAIFSNDTTDALISYAKELGLDETQFTNHPSAKNAGKLQSKILEKLNTENRRIYTNSIAERLFELGVPAKEAKNSAQILTRMLSGENITQREQRQIDTQPVAHVLSDLDVEAVYNAMPSTVAQGIGYTVPQWVQNLRSQLQNKRLHTSTVESLSNVNYADRLVKQMAQDQAELSFVDGTPQAVNDTASWQNSGSALPDSMRMEYQRNAAHSIGFDAEAEQALRRMSADYDEQTQQALIDNYDYNQSPSEYAAAFDVVYNAAMQEGVALNDIYNLPGTTNLSDSQILAAMRAGRRARETAAQTNVEQTAQNRSDAGGSTVDKTYNKYYYKKAIKITKQEHSRVRAALAEKYARRHSEGQRLPVLDYVHLGEQGKLNTAYIYVVRNYDFGSFEVVGKHSSDSKPSENARRGIDEFNRRTGIQNERVADAGRSDNGDMRSDTEIGREVSEAAGLDRGASESERAGSAVDVAGDLGRTGRRGRDGERATTAERGIETDRDVQEDRYANEDRAWRAEYENEQQAQQKSLVKSIQNLFGRKDNNTGISEITRTIEKLFDVPVSTGHIAQRNALGIFKKKAEAIRAKVANALPVIAHELGHALDKTYKFTEKTEINEAAGVLARERPGWIDQYPVSERPGEAVAEFFRNYLTDKQSTKQRYPAFYEMVRSTLSKKDLANLDTVADMVNRYMVRDQSERLKSAIVSVNQANKLNRKNQEYNELLEQFAIDWTDDLVAIKNKIGQEAYDLAMNSRKINVKIANTLTGAYMSDMDGAPVQVGTQNGKPVYMPGLSTILKPVNDTVEMIEDFNHYLICKHAPEVLEQGKRVFADDTLNTLEFVNAEAQRLEKQYPQFEATAKAFYKWQDTFMREWFVRSGFSTLKAYNELRGRYPYYVPFMRNVGGRLGGNARRGFANQSTPLKRLKGSGREIINPVEATMLRVKEIMTKAERNRVMQEVSRVAMNEDGIGRIIERVPPKMVAKIVDISQQKNNLLELLGDKLEGDMLDDVWNDIEQTFDDQIANFVPGVNQGEDIVRVFVNGKQQYYQIHDENLLASLVGLGEETSNIVVRFFRGFTQFLKYLTTGGNFIWSITSNSVRDFDSAFKKSQTTNNPIKFIKDSVSSAVNIIKNSEEYKLYKTAGGGYNNSLTANPRQWKSISREVVKQHESDFKRFVRTKLNLVEKIATFSDVTESVQRLAEFKRVLEQTGGDTKTALRAADEITVNFQRHGRYGKTVDAFVPYFNASLQGLVSLYQSVKTRPFIIKSVTAAVFTTVLQFSWNKLIAPALFGADDDEYEKLSEYKKNNYYNLSLGNGYFISIPKSKDTGVLNSFFERVTEFFTSNDPDMKEMVLDFGGYLWSTFVPPGLSPSDLVLFGTFYDIAKNEDFKGSPIVPASYEDLPPEYQYNENTTWIAKQLGNLFGLSPMQIDYFINDNLGILGDVNQSVGAQEKDWTFGVLNRIRVDNTYSTDVTNKFYDRYDTLKEYYNADPNLTENTAEYKLYSQARSVVSALNAYAREDESMARTYRQMVNAYIEDFEKNGADPDQRVVDLYERTKDQDLFLERDFKRDYTVNGEKITMPVDAFLSYVEEYQDKAAEMYDKIFELHLSDEATVKLLNDAKGEIKDYVDAKYKTAVDEGEPFEEPENWMEEAFKQMYQDAKRKSAKTEQEQKDKVEYIDILKQLF